MPKGSKYGGRKAGTPNKVTAELRSHITSILQSCLPDALNIIEDIDDPKKRIDAITALLPYVIPKMTQVDLGAGDDVKKITVEIIKGK